MIGCRPAFASKFIGVYFRFIESDAGGDVNTIFGWNNVPATRVAIAISSFWPAKTLTCRARESSGRLTVPPLRIRLEVGSSAVTEGICGSNLRGCTKRSSSK